MSMYYSQGLKKFMLHFEKNKISTFGQVTLEPGRPSPGKPAGPCTPGGPACP